MKPHTYRVHYVDQNGPGFVDKSTRREANGLCIILRGQGCSGVYVQPIGY